MARVAVRIFECALIFDWKLGDSVVLTFTPFVRFADISEFSIEGPLSHEWDCSYVQTNGNSGSSTPSGNGSGLTLKKFDAKRYADFLAGSTSFSYEIRKYWDRVYSQNRLIYIVRSDRYPVLYVGITEGGLDKGVFGVSGRLAHHVRKIFAIKSGKSTNHTAGWRSHAVERYQNLCNEHANMNERECTSFADDLQISFGTFENSDQAPADHEGYVLCVAFERLQGTATALQVMNTGAMFYRPVSICFI